MNIEITSNFKKVAQKAILSIVFFIIFYFLLLLLAIVLAIACFALGVLILKAKFGFVTVLLGIGVMGVGVIVVFFLIKFIFKTNKTDLSEYTEITRNQHPKLFKLIDEVVQKTDTKFPKHVYISTQVNASVFYDSSFWSMFLPVRKNLHIGLGLVNSVTHDEFKAIIAHEFGHFSQKSMKVGSYVYQVNHIVYNMLNDNTSFNRLVEKWMNISSYFSIFVVVAYKIIEGIQWSLQKMYNYVNKSYLGLSREMEFHADAVAASIAGSEAVETSLMRIDLADVSFNNVLNLYNDKIKNSLISENIFKDHSFMLHFLAKNNNIPILHSFPQVTLLEQKRLVKSKLIIENQWASHPSVEERVKAIKKINSIQTNLNFTPATDLFSEVVDLQKRMTKKLFSNINYENNTQFFSEKEFIDSVEKKHKIFSYNNLYNEFYDFYSPLEINSELLDTTNLSFEELFADQKVDDLIELQSLESDLSNLEAIRDNFIVIQTFDYDGVKYKSNQANTLINQLNIVLNEIKENIKLNDQLIYSYFYKKAETKFCLAQYYELVHEYLDGLVKFQTNQELIHNAYNDLYFVNNITPFKTIYNNFSEFKKNEILLKKFLSEVKTENWFENEIDSNGKEKIEMYVNSDFVYFENDMYSNDNLQILFGILDLMYDLNRKLFLHKKQDWLDFQISLIN